MPAEPSVETVAIRTQAREAEKAARDLVARAAHMQKLARRLRLDSTEQLNLNARARELHDEAARLLTEVSDLSRQIVG